MIYGNYGYPGFGGYQYLMPRAPETNQELGVTEYQGRLDPQAVVNQYGIVDHGRSFLKNLGSGFMDGLGAIPVIGNFSNLLRSGFNYATGDAGNGADSLVKAIPLIGNLYSGASALKNAGDAWGIHFPGMFEQAMKGGYDQQTRTAQALVSGNMGLGLSAMYSGYYPYMRYGGY
ncbi:MAG: hypothetical protein U1E65_03025 [Myxococcota bacterium]